jgi:hypothetical protein
MRRFILHFLLSLGCAFAPCLNVASAASNGREASAPLDEDKYQAYVDKIAKATREDADRIAPQYPPSGETFDELAAAGAENIDFCIRYLAENNETWPQRGIALYSMYKLDVDDYVVFVRKLAKLYHSGLLSQRELSGAIYYRYSLVAVEKYNNPKIQALFKEMAAQEDIPPDIKEKIRYIRSGEGFAEMRKRDFAVHALVRDAIDLSVRFVGDTDIVGLCGFPDDVVIGRRLGNAAADAGLESIQILRHVDENDRARWSLMSSICQFNVV